MKQCYVDASMVPMEHGNGTDCKRLLGPEHGCQNDCATGISYYHTVEFPPAQAHAFQEGFYVISGAGTAKVGECEFPIREGFSFLVPAQVLHTVKSNDPSVPVVLFWFHAA